jgi:dethiobiotin synthetase
MTSRRLFITGTDTGVGKSVATAAMLCALRTRGLRAVGMKPLASGCEATAAGWRNEDALLLQSVSDPTPDYDDVNPYALPLPLAPELAAADAGMEISLAPILAAHARLAAQADAVVVEGVGGWAAPLSATLDQADLVRALDLPVVLVVGLRLGCLNHARLTARAIAAASTTTSRCCGNACRYRAGDDCPIRLRRIRNAWRLCSIWRGHHSRDLWEVGVGRRMLDSAV